MKEKFELDIYNPQSLEAMLKVASKFAEAEIVPKQFQKKPADLLVVLQMGYELGIAPVRAINSISVINGKPTLNAELQLALIYERYPSAFVKIEEDEKKKEVKVTMARDRAALETSYTAIWNEAKAGAMGLLEKDNYRKQKMTMFKWRAIAEARRFVFPDICSGILAPEEAQDIIQTEKTTTIVEPESIETVKIDLAAETPLDKLRAVLSTIENGEARLLKHLSVKAKIDINALDQLTSEEIEYSLNFLKQFSTQGA